MTAQAFEVTWETCAKCHHATDLHDRRAEDGECFICHALCSMPTCDFCGFYKDDAMFGDIPDWNTTTGCHLTCEVRDRRTLSEPYDPAPENNENIHG